MSWQPPLWLGGPVLEWELRRARRRPWVFLFRSVYGGWLAVQLFLLTASFYEGLHAVRRDEYSWWRQTDNPMFGPNPGEMAVTFAQNYVTLFAFQQMIILLLVTPAMVAGALGAEKEKGTLGLLFSTDLSAFEIILGKLLGRLLFLGQVLLVGFPVFLVMGLLADAPLSRLVLIELQACVVALALAAVTLLVSVLSRSTREAILGCYATLVLVYIGLGMVVSGSLPIWVEPFTALERFASPPYDQRLGAAWGQPVTWACTAVLCLTITFLWLRPIGVRQLEGADKRHSGLLWAFRPRMGNHPIRWREQHVIGLAPLPHLRLVPGWLAKLGVLGFAVILVTTALTNMSQSIFYRLLAGEFASVWRTLEQFEPGRVLSEVVIMGIVLLVIGIIVVAVRAATCISEERRRKTWDDIVMTPLDLEEIRWEKMWGILRATHVYLLLYVMPMLALAATGGIAVLVLASCFAVGAWFAMLMTAIAGTEASLGAVRD